MFFGVKKLPPHKPRRDSAATRGYHGSCHRWPIHPSLCERLRWPAAHQKGHPHGATKHHLVISGRGKNGRKSWMEEKEVAFLWRVVVERYSYTISWEHDRFCKKRLHMDQYVQNKTCHSKKVCSELLTTICGDVAQLFSFTASFWALFGCLGGSCSFWMAMNISNDGSLVWIRKSWSSADLWGSLHTGIVWG